MSKMFSWVAFPTKLKKFWLSEARGKWESTQDGYGLVTSLASFLVPSSTFLPS